MVNILSHIFHLSFSEPHCPFTNSPSSLPRLMTCFRRSHQLEAWMSWKTIATTSLLVSCLYTKMEMRRKHHLYFSMNSFKVLYCNTFSNMLSGISYMHPQTNKVSWDIARQARMRRTKVAKVSLHNNLASEFPKKTSYSNQFNSYHPTPFRSCNDLFKQCSDCQLRGSQLRRGGTTFISSWSIKVIGLPF